MKDILISSIFILVGLLFASLSLNYKFGSLESMGPGFFPLVFSCCLILLGIINIFKKWLNGH